jgi:replicative DNA helicase
MTDHALLTGIPALDAIMTPFSPGEVTLIAGRPATGKSTLAAQIATNVARAGRTVCLHSIAQGYHTDQAAELIKRDELSVSLHDAISGCSLVKIAKSVSTLRTGLPDLLIIDDLRFVSVEMPELSPSLQAALIAHELQVLAISLHIPVLAIDLLSRTAERRIPGPPQLDDLRSMTQAETASQVILLYRPGYYVCDGWAANRAMGLAPGDTTTVEAFVAKQRHGRGAGRAALLQYDPETLRFRDDANASLDGQAEPAH